MNINEGHATTDDGVRLYFRVMGNGSEVVLIPNATYLFEDFRHLADRRTVIFYDLRNRGRSDSVDDESKLVGGIHNDVEDMEAIRRHFGLPSVAVIGHSYLGMIVVLYAMRYRHANRVVQIGSVPPVHEQYPAHLTGADAVFTDLSGRIAQLQQEGPGGDVKEFDRKMRSLVWPLYLVNPADVSKISWRIDDLPNESFPRLMKYGEMLMASVRDLRLGAEDFAKVAVPVLAVHGTRDRQAPYGGGREFVMKLPNARLITVENAAHLPWIEFPEKVFPAIETFLDGNWPDQARRITTIDPIMEGNDAT